MCQKGPIFQMLIKAKTHDSIGNNVHILVYLLFQENLIPQNTYSKYLHQAISTDDQITNKKYFNAVS